MLKRRNGDLKNAVGSHSDFFDDAVIHGDLDRKQSRKEMSRVNMARAAYISQLHKFNNFMQHRLLGQGERQYLKRERFWFLGNH